MGIRDMISVSHGLQADGPHRERLTNKGCSRLVRAFMAALGVALVATTTTSCDNRSEEPSQYTLARDRADALVADLASEFRADADWNQGFAGRSEVFTFELQRALVRPDGSPVVIRARVGDIRTLNGTDDVLVDAQASWGDFTFLSDSLHLRLSCSGDTMKDILDSPELHELIIFGGGTEYAFVVIARDLAKLPSDAESSTAWTVSGECLAGVRLGD